MIGFWFEKLRIPFAGSIELRLIDEEGPDGELDGIWYATYQPRQRPTGDSV